MTRFYTINRAGGFHLQDNKIKSITTNLLLDENNSKWIATSKGLSIMIGDHIENYTTKNSNILSNQVNDIAMAPGGRLWIASRDLCPSGIRPV